MPEPTKDVPVPLVKDMPDAAFDGNPATLVVGVGFWRTHKPKK